MTVIVIEIGEWIRLWRTQNEGFAAEVETVGVVRGGDDATHYRQVRGRHAILKDSSPSANSTVAGPDVPLKLQFNVRIDAARSRLQLVNPDNSIVDLTADKQGSPDTLRAKMTGLKTGAYKIRWQVLAPDGHITRGEIPFKVGT